MRGAATSTLEKRKRKLRIMPEKSVVVKSSSDSEDIDDDLAEISRVPPNGSTKVDEIDDDSNQADENETEKYTNKTDDNASEISEKSDQNSEI